MVQIDLIPSVPNYRLSTTLDGVVYVLDVRWNTREGVWYLDVRDTDGEVIRAGLALVLGPALGWRTTDARWPPGVFQVVDLAASGTEAGLDDLGTRVALYYYEESDFA